MKGLDNIETARKLKLRAVKQKDEVSCGYCATYAVMRYFKIQVKQKQLRQDLGVDSFLPYFTKRQAIEDYIKSKVSHDLDGTWPMDIYAVLRAYGLKTQPLSYNTEQFLMEASELVQSKYPVLLLTLYSGEEGMSLHWSVLIGINRRGVYVADSCEVCPECSNGHYLYSYNQFNDAFLGGIGVCPDAKPPNQMRNRDYLRAYSDGACFTVRAIRNAFCMKSRGLSFQTLKKTLFT